MKLGLELGPIVGLDDVHTKRQPAYDLVDELNRRSLVAGVVYLQHANPRAVINRRELVQSLPRAGDALEQLDVHLQAMTRLRLLVPLPALLVWAVLLVCREPLHAVLTQDPMDRGARDLHFVKALQIVGDAAGAEVVLLAKVQNLTDDLRFRGVGRALRRSWLVAQTGGPDASNLRFHL